ncbi:uncharacterized protein LOC103316705 [Nasonia vitripennis]|uniref:Uncharacterized protein n=1 Tax=Nasonia vitripennis TaxID=7425 RepID=A0A7M7H909_NASVI|nr:uncharacterized protein LOC103316705 [Nasonia vitripennis]XP_016843837.1 uncharacterized protein LOC103316705 [Nasonia vitripennis]
MAIEDTSIFLVVILAVGGISMMTTLLACYICIFRDLCCRSQPFKSTKNLRRRARTKKRRKKKGDCANQQKPGSADIVTLYDLTQPADISMPTESENL